jgi:transcriptional regulator with XRE-family HTH domain
MDGEKLAKLRYAKGHTLRSLAERSGVAFYTIWAIEQGRTKRPHPGTLSKLADALGVAPEELLFEGKALPVAA